MDPIGTLRREEHEDGYTLWARMDPGYPDNQFTDTEWTAIWSTAPGNISARRGDKAVQEFPVFGRISGTPSVIGEDISLEDKVMISGVTGECITATVVGIEDLSRFHPEHRFTLRFQGEGDKTIRLSNFQRSDFELLEDEN